MALEQAQYHCNRCGQPTLHQRNTKESSHLGCLIVLIVLAIISLVFPLSLIVTVPALVVGVPIWLLLALVALLSSQPPFRCAHCGQAAGELAPVQRIAVAQQCDIERAVPHEYCAKQANARAASMRHLFSKSLAVLQSASRRLGCFAVTAIRQANRLLLKMAGGEDNMILYRFFQIVVVSIPVWAIAIAIAISSSKQARIEHANQDVRGIVENAEKWIQDGQLTDADKIEERLHAAESAPEATQKSSIVPTLAAFRTAKAERQAAAILKSALKAIDGKEFDKSQALLRQYLDHQYAKERKKAKTLLAEIPPATSDDDALQTLLAMDDTSFASLSKGDFSVVVLSYPALVDTRIATLKKNLAEATRQREDKQKRAEAAREAARIADQRRVAAAKEAIQRSDERRRLALEKKEAEARNREALAQLRAFQEEARTRERVAAVDRKAEAIELAQKLIKTFLRYPDEASFGWFPDCVEDENEVSVAYSVKAKNAFGVSETQEWVITFKKSSGGLRIGAIQLDGKILGR